MPALPQIDRFYPYLLSIRAGPNVRGHMSRSLTVGWERHFSVLAKTLHFDRVLKINDCIADLDIDIMDAFGWSGTADAFPATCQRVVNSSIFKIASSQVSWAPVA